MTSEIKEQNKDVFKIAKIQKSYHPYAPGDGVEGGEVWQGG